MRTPLNAIAIASHNTRIMIKSVMKWWSKCISMIITKTASRNVAFKLNPCKTSQADVLTRQVVTEGLSSNF